MEPPASPGGDGPTQAPPPLPPGWIAQWDANSKKYYFVQISTGQSQWEVPTSAAPIGGGTPAPVGDHPYGAPGGGQSELITHPDGSQTVKHPDGRMEPVMPDEHGNARGMGDGATGDRGIGSIAMNALLGGGKQSGSGHGSSNQFGGIATQVFSGFTHNNSGNNGGSGNHGASGGGSGLGGKLVSQLASGLFSSSNKPTPQNYHSGQQATQHQSSGGLAGSVMGGVASFLGGQSQSSHNQNYGYSNAGQTGGYSGSAPPATYQPSNLSHQASQHTPQHSQPSSSYQSPALNTGPHSIPSFQAPSQQPPNPYGQAPQQHGTPSFPPPPSGGYEGQQHQQGYPGSAQHTHYGQHGQIPGPPQGQPPAHQQYGHPQGTVNQYSQPHHRGAFGEQQPAPHGGQQGGSFNPYQALPQGQGQYPSSYANPQY